MCIQRAAEKAALFIENKRLSRKVETANQALTEKVDDLENCVKMAMDYEKKINEMNRYIRDLEARIHLTEKKVAGK